MKAELYKGSDWFPKDTVLHTPEDCLAAYNQGLAGAFIDEEATSNLVSTMTHKTFTDVMSAWAREGISQANEPGGLYLNAMAAVIICEANRIGIINDTTFNEQTFSTISQDERVNPWDERQGTGDCTSHGTRNHCDGVRASEIVYGQEAEGWHVRTATEIHYGDRGHSGQGANSGRLRNFVCNKGGMFLRKNYPELGVDLSVYNWRIGDAMGARGVPQKFIDYSKPNNVRQLTQCKSLDEAITACRNGFTVSGGGMHSFSEKRDENGFSQWTGPTWAHDTYGSMAMDERPETIKLYKGRLFLYQNSWGKWNSGGRRIRGTNIFIPIGSMWIHETALARMIREGEYYIMAGANGFKPLKIPNFGFTGYI